MEHVNHCRKCGRCCWNWKDNDASDKCEHLADDMKTCTIYDQLAELMPQCHAFPTDIHCVCDLPPDCGYVIYWKSKGLL